jgi:hypothetical protein
MADLGNIIYKRYTDGEEVDEEQKALCQEIDQHKEQIARYKDTLADMKGKKICPACQEAVDREVSFCPFCGAPVPTPEPEAEESAAEEEESAETEEPETAEDGAADAETEKAGDAGESVTDEPAQASEAEQENETAHEQAVE